MRASRGLFARMAGHEEETRSGGRGRGRKDYFRSNRGASRKCTINSLGPVKPFKNLTIVGIILPFKNLTLVTVLGGVIFPGLIHSVSSAIFWPNSGPGLGLRLFLGPSPHSGARFCFLFSEPKYDRACGGSSPTRQTDPGQPQLENDLQADRPGITGLFPDLLDHGQNVLGVMPFPDSRSSLKRRLGILHLVELGDGVLAMIARYGAEFVNGKTYVLSVRS